MEKMLGAPSLYFTPQGKAQLEASARDNIRRSHPMSQPSLSETVLSKCFCLFEEEDGRGVGVGVGWGVAKGAGSREGIGGGRLVCFADGLSFALACVRPGKSCGPRQTWQSSRCETRHSTSASRQNQRQETKLLVQIGLSAWVLGIDFAVRERASAVTRVSCGRRNQMQETAVLVQAVENLHALWLRAYDFAECVRCANEGSAT
eukprot:840606-Rhodomonas_salina.1